MSPGLSLACGKEQEPGWEPETVRGPSEAIMTGGLFILSRSWETGRTVTASCVFPGSVPNHCTAGSVGYKTKGRTNKKAAEAVQAREEVSLREAGIAGMETRGAGGTVATRRAAL